MAVYSFPSDLISDLLNAFKSKEANNEIIEELLLDVKTVDSDCVVFNW